MNRQEYNKKYYENNKSKILAKLQTKTVCELCGRSVSHQNIAKHKASSYCKSKQMDTTKEINDIKNQITELKAMLENR